MTLTEPEALQLFKDAGAFLAGHFVLTSGMHSPHYVEKFRVLEHPAITAKLCAQIAENFSDAGTTIVVGPMTGGILLAHEVAKELGVRAMFTERINGNMVFRRGFTITSTDRVLLVEDIVTTGGSIFEVIEAVKETRAEILGLGFLVDRSGGRVDFGIPAKPLITLNVVTYRPEQCPLCQQGIPPTKPGSSGKNL